jgi:hypothetical protein
LRLDHWRKVVKLVEIVGLERVLIKAPVYRGLEKETAEPLAKLLGDFEWVAR